MSKRALASEAPPAAKKTKLIDTRAEHCLSNMQIDEDLHSRQLAVYGRASMRRMALSDILICGALGLGVETGTRMHKAIFDKVPQVFEALRRSLLTDY